MPFTLGTEGQPDYYAYELALAAHKVVTEVTPVQPGQQVVITADTASDPRAVQATAQATFAVGGGAHCYLVPHFAPGLHGPAWSGS